MKKFDLYKILMDICNDGVFSLRLLKNKMEEFNCSDEDNPYSSLFWYVEKAISEGKDIIPIKDFIKFLGTSEKDRLILVEEKRKERREEDLNVINNILKIIRGRATVKDYSSCVDLYRTIIIIHLDNVKEEFLSIKKFLNNFYFLISPECFKTLSLWNKIKHTVKDTKHLIVCTSLKLLIVLLYLLIIICYFLSGYLPFLFCLLFSNKGA